MKIIRITTLLDFGGQERKYISFTENKSLLHHDYIFAAIGHGGHAENLIRERGFTTKIFNKNPKISNLKNIWMLYKWFKKEKPDVVHTAAAEANFHGIIAAKMARIPVIIGEEIGFPAHSNKAKKVFKIVYSFAHKVICVSKAVKEFLISINEINTEKGIVIYNPVSLPKTVEISKSDVFTIVCVGRLEVVKNQQLLIHAFSKLSNKNLKLILVGDGREKQNLETLIKTLQLEDKVTITGFSSEPEKYLAQASLFVLPSLSEGFGIAVVEAMQMGLPCLCSSVGGIPEFIEENKTGWLFDPKNPNEMVEKLEKIISLPNNNLIEVGQNGKKFTSNAFTTEIYVNNLESLYIDLSKK